MKKTLLTALLTLSVFSVSAQLIILPPPGTGYQAILLDPSTGQVLDIRENSLSKCRNRVQQEIYNYSIVLNSCSASIFPAF